MGNQIQHISFEGIGSKWWIKIFDGEVDKSTIEEKILDTLNIFEKNYSRFIPDSLISILNSQRILSSFPIELYEMILFAEKVRKITHDHFNVSVGSNLEKLGYDSTYSFREKKFEVRDIGFEEITETRIRIAKGTSIDLGGIGKGWLIDKFSKLLLENNVEHFVVNGGGDIYATSNFDDPIEFLLENPFDTTEMIGSISIKNSSIACSAPNRRKWIEKSSKKIYHHLIDNVSGLPVDSISAVFTQGNNALLADTASTALFVSPQELWNIIAKKLEVEYLVIFENGSFFKTNNYKGTLN